MQAKRILRRTQEPRLRNYPQTLAGGLYATSPDTLEAFRVNPSPAQCLCPCCWGRWGGSFALAQPAIHLGPKGAAEFAALLSTLHDGIERLHASNLAHGSGGNRIMAIEATWTHCFSWANGVRNGGSIGPAGTWCKSPGDYMMFEHGTTSNGIRVSSGEWKNANNRCLGLLSYIGSESRR